jgi:hypothetical protein
MSKTSTLTAAWFEPISLTPESATREAARNVHGRAVPGKPSSLSRPADSHTSPLRPPVPEGSLVSWGTLGAAVGRRLRYARSATLAGPARFARRRCSLPSAYGIAVRLRSEVGQNSFGNSSLAESR